MGTPNPGTLQEQQLIPARQLLRHRQEEAAVRSGLRPQQSHPSVLSVALEDLNQQTHFEPTHDPSDPNAVRRGIFKFDRCQELRRIQLAEDLIRRVNPGPYEDPSYLALLAFQAASIEMAFEQLTGKEEAERWSQFLLGTVHSPEVNAFAMTFRHDRHAVIVMCSAFVDFVYQAAKALTAAQNPVRSDRPDATVTTHTAVKSIEKMLDSHPEPVERLYRTLEAYFYKGYPRAFMNEVVPDLQQPSLGVLIGLSERWALAHEYGHVFARDLHWTFPAGVNPNWAQEFFADHNATILSVISTSFLDGMPPELSLAGGIFVFACMDVLRRAVAIARDGTESAVDQDMTHPPYKMRAEQLIRTFYHFFDVTYDGPRHKDLTFVANRPAAPAVSDSVREHIRHAFDFANGLFAIWKRAKERLIREYQSGRPLHRMWLAQ